MNPRETLTSAQVDILSDCNLPLERSRRDFTRSINAPDFELGLRIKTSLDAVEARSDTTPSLRLLAFYINAEYRLWYMWAHQAIEHNPFLSHFVETVQRLDRPYHWVSPGYTLQDITAVRVQWIKTLLHGINMHNEQSLTPVQIYTRFIAYGRGGVPFPFDLQRYIELLLDEGIYNQSDADAYAPAPLNIMHDFTQRDITEQIKESILRQLETEPDQAVGHITRLPIELIYLDYLTHLIADRVLEHFSIDHVCVVQQYVQHALRDVEQAGRPPSSADTGGNANGEYGRDAQTRYIKLLLLFIGNLIRKRLVEPETLYYEISEITVRYVWLKEVRDFKKWLENGDEDDIPPLGV